MSIAPAKQMEKSSIFILLLASGMSKQAVLTEALRTKTYRQKPFVEFDLRERGKIRHIKSMHISDRVVQRAACDTVFVPALRPYLIYDNGASLEGKGVDFARRRLEIHLHKFYRKYGNHGYILLLDCSKFFDNLPHDILCEKVHGKIPEDCEELFKYLISTFNIDVSGLTDDEIAEIRDGVFNSLEYEKHKNSSVTGEKYLEKSVGIGSQISQICGTFLPTYVDNYIKIVKGVKFYGRYMDDSYIISDDLNFLHQIEKEIEALYKSLGLTINKKKTQIQRIDKGFTWLQTKYFVTDSGRIVKRVSQDRIVRMRRKLKKLKIKMDNNVMQYKDIVQTYESCRGSMKKFNSHYSLLNLDRLFKDLYGGENYERTRTETAANM